MSRKIKFRAWNKNSNKTQLIKSIFYADNGFAGISEEVLTKPQVMSNIQNCEVLNIFKFMICFLKYLILPIFIIISSLLLFYILVVILIIH
ncbi:MAG: hypothetical protein K0R54_778 [Clostridiaceae bacterium]|jgi:hypothetical protein|nr:hypothetical protein [Clostridiaceae bacterium]